MKNTVLTIMLLFAVNAEAELIETTNPLLDSTFVDVGVSHWDTTTGLEWLDFGNLVEGPMTFGHSINSAEITYDETNGDWRLATYNEVYALWDRFFFPDYDGGDTGTMTIGEGDGSSLLIQSRNSWIFAFGTDAEVTGPGLLTAITDENSALSSRGWYLAEDGSVQMMGVKIATNSIENGELNTTFYGPDYQWDGLTRDSWGDWAGVYMVRDYSVVPIPAAIWLFVSGLLGLVAVARRKR